VLRDGGTQPRQTAPPKYVGVLRDGGTWADNPSYFLWRDMAEPQNGETLEERRQLLQAVLQARSWQARAGTLPYGTRVPAREVLPTAPRRFA